MTAKVRVRAAVLATFVVVLGTAGFATNRLGNTASAGASAAALTVFLGDVQVHRPGGLEWAKGNTGDSLAEGTRVRTGSDAKAALTLPDGSVTRLDGGTELLISGLSRAAGGGTRTQFTQLSGTTWNSVRQLVAGGSYRVSGPNNSTAEVRGTDFSFVISGSDAMVEVWAGAVQVAAGQQPPVLVPAGGETVIHPNSAPTLPHPIPIEQRRDSFTVFNQTVEATGHVPSKVNGDSAAPGTVSRVVAGGTASGDDTDGELSFTLGWPGSTFELTLIGPDGAVYASQASSQPPVTLTVPHPARGVWSYQVRDIESDPSEAYWVVVTSSKSPVAGTTSTEAPREPTDKSKSPAPATRSKPAVAATPTPSPSASTDGSKSTSDDSAAKPGADDSASKSKSDDAGSKPKADDPAPKPAPDDSGTKPVNSKPDDAGSKAPDPKPVPPGTDPGDPGSVSIPPGIDKKPGDLPPGIDSKPGDLPPGIDKKPADLPPGIDKKPADAPPGDPAPPPVDPTPAPVPAPVPVPVASPPPVPEKKPDAPHPPPGPPSETPHSPHLPVGIPQGPTKKSGG